ncbi:8-oxo-dGTP diphosphatase [Micromonospora saelicesensis]|uniref:8-oxo-dGTP diphosphatase n=1 Tax=Micromonospora saelicesensis TaxID=285676 RepID=A0ABX9CFE9_9ACTN|nr:NUDIX domain-containing protein [Micromonospora saelicesensis]RAN95936.1 8-oxo-dGTP diphosphatase [Micromonospora saelicesensis]
MQFARRVGVYGLLRNSGRVLVVRDGAEGEFPGVWRLPGGAVRHAENPERAVVRQVAEQAGLTVAVTRLLTVVADVATLPEDKTALHTDRLLFELSTPHGALSDGARPASAGPGSARPESVGPGGGLRGVGAGLVDQACWLSLAEVTQLPLTPFTAEALGLPVTPLPPAAHRSRGLFPPQHPDRRLRFGAYGLVTDPAGRILLTQIAEGYPGAGLWHLPGGGTDHGEQPATGLLRELIEEGGQVGRVVELLGVNNLHNPAALGPEGRPLDWHGVRVIYRVLVDVPTDAVVTESAGGSTARAGWFTRDEATDLPLSDIAVVAIGQSGR